MLLNQPDPWGAHASMYDKGFAPITSMYAFDMLQFAQLPSGSTCVDVGCGPGVAAAIAAQRGVHVIATDFSQGMVDMATAKLKALGLPFEAKVMVMMAAELPGFVVPEQFPTGVPALFKAEVEAAGFQDVTVRSVSHDVVFESGKDMIDAFADHPFMAGGAAYGFKSRSSN
ncbi:S-adenosyl-L-methionine-dependent methyltransferase [Tribonema minus]|uniref:S-adenosyl-L-methionine-dependent methyltransferase n=1 Tax=Tribonema minus TaxID=303371 RepID=A0A835Z1I3_9STRA|nr:S-adenosyl-L-methionine-dependent methyltransferase [Tribonema minus]